ncbi:MAG TPA: hypothetical protein VF710_01650, partial [Longimicrobium sp.]|jgi:hypothetical protein
LLALLCPWPTQVAPEWELQALGPDGEPVPYLLARESWRDATAMGDRLERTTLTGPDGKVRFKSRWAWASTAERVWRLARLGEYCDVTFALVRVWDEGYTGGVARYSIGDTLPRQVHVRVDTSDVRQPVIGRQARLARHPPPGKGHHECLLGS